MGDDGEIVKYFPMPSFRPKQRETLVKCFEKLEEGKKLILLQAPVGFGKSAVNTALCRYYTPSVYTTPQLSLIDQILSDEYLGRFFVEIKGRENYRCKKDHYLTTVKYGKCRRERNVIPDECNWLKECPYYSQKLRAIMSPMALMSTAYFIVDAFQEPPNFSSRRLVVIDEGHFLSEFVASHVELEISPKSLPRRVWERVKGNPRNVIDVMTVVEEFLESLGDNLTEEEAKDKVRAEEWMSRAKRFIDSEMIAEWIWTEKNGGVSAVPVHTRWIMPQMIWDRGEKFIVSSATILKPELWIRENGADLRFSGDEIAFINVGMTFPVERRRVIDAAVGSMRHDHQKDSLEAAVKMIEYIIRSHDGKNIAIHVPSYRLANDIYWMLSDDVKERCYLPSPENRDEVLEKWKQNGGILLAVAYHEGQDWKYDTCNVQILAKTLYPDTTDPRIRRRIERKEFDWLMWVALVKCLQAYGRAIRAEDDYMEFYVIDDQFWELIRMRWKYVPDWFKEAVPENRWPKTARKKRTNKNNIHDQ